jgi:hypothetical protein
MISFNHSRHPSRPWNFPRRWLAYTWEAKGDWTRAHESAQQAEGIDGAWVHAYLHRKEGDQDNAAYWYRRAGKHFCEDIVDAEWRSIAEDLLRSG